MLYFCIKHTSRSRSTFHQRYKELVVKPSNLLTSRGAIWGVGRFSMLVCQRQGLRVQEEAITCKRTTVIAQVRRRVMVDKTYIVNC